MNTALLLLALLNPQEIQDPNKPPPGSAPSYATADLVSAEDPRLTHTQWIRLAAAEEPQKCPRHPWVFPFVTAGYGRTDAGQSGVNIRFRVFSQYRNETLDNDPSVWASRMLLRMWDINFHRLGIDNPERYKKEVHVFLCTEGEPGGEHMFVNADLGTPSKPNFVDMNAIFVYQVQTLTEPIEFAREVAHEYGHASLPQIGPFQGPEAWANGDVGERIFLKWLAEDVRSGKLSSADVAKTKQADLDNYVAARVTPLVKKTAESGPDLSLLAKDTKEAYNAYVALACYGQAVLPAKAFGRALKITAGNRGSDFAAALVDACEEVSELELRVPEGVSRRTLWLPLGKGSVVNGSVRARKGDWAQVTAGGPTIKIRNPKPKT